MTIYLVVIKELTECIVPQERNFISPICYHVYTNMYCVVKLAGYQLKPIKPFKPIF